MANKKDVELVLRAQNKASKDIDAVAESLKVLESVSKDLNQATTKSSGLLNKLGAELKQLEGETKALKNFSTAAADVEAAAAAFVRLTEAVKKAEGVTAGLAQKYRQASQAVTAFRNQAAQAASEFAQQEEATKKTAAALKEINSAVSQAEKQYKALSQQLKKSKNPSDELRNSLQQQRAALDALLAEQVRAEALNKQAVAAERAKRTAMLEADAAVETAVRNRKNLRTQLESSIRSLRAERTELTGLRSAFETVNAAATNVASKLGADSVAAADLAAAAGRAQAQIDALAKAQARLANANNVKTAVNADGTAGKDQYLEQSRLARTAAKDMREASQEVTRLSKAMAEAETPTRELSNAFLVAKATSAAATKEHQVQVAALNKLQGSAKGGFAAFVEAESKIRSATAATAQSGRQAVQSANELQRLNQAIKNLGSAWTNVAASTNRATAATRAATVAQDQYNNPTRTALSLIQRLRGQVLSLTAAYIGFFGAIQEFRNVIAVIRQAEQAQARFRVAFDGSNQAVASEMAFVREQAVRLGQDFASLSDNYSRLLFSGRAAGFELDQIRNIFLGLSEAARVNGTSIDDTAGVFRAFDQIISKTKVQAEELRGQLGDRMSGAFQLFAEAIGVSTQKLDEMLKEGQVLATGDLLTRFADTLRAKYGKELPAALQTTSAEVDRFFGLLNLARIDFANGGFGSEFTAALRDLNKYLASSDAKSFFKALGDAAGFAIRAITFLVKNFEALARLFEIIAIAKITQGLLSLGNAAKGARAAINAIGLAFMAAGRQALLTQAISGSLFTGLIAGARSLLIALGPAGWIAAGLGAIALGVELWFNRTEEVNGAMERHERIISKVRNAYSDIAQGVDDWKNRLQDLSEEEIQLNIRQVQKQLQDAREALSGPTGALWAPLNGNAANEIRRLIALLQNGSMTAAEFRQKLLEVQKWEPEAITDDYVDGILKQVDAVAEKEQALKQLGVAENLQKGIVDEAAAAEAGLTEAVAKTTDQLEEHARVVAKADDAIAKLTEGIPELKDQLEFSAAIKSVQDLVAEMQKIGVPPEKLAEIKKLAELNMNAAASKLGGSNFNGSALDLIKQFEGFRETPYWDVNAYRAGYGSDTVTLDDGSVQRITQGMKVSQADALRDLVRRIGEFQAVIKAQIGDQRFNALSKEQQAALTSIAYNYGELPGRIVDAVRNGSAEEMARAVRGLAGDNGGVNADRRNAEADILAKGSPELTAQLAEIEQKRLETAKQYTEERAKSIEDSKFELEQQQLLNTGLESNARQVAINKFLRDQENEAIKAGITYTDEMRQADEARAAAAYDAQNQTRLATEERQRVDEAVNVLLERQRMLMEQIQFYREQGNNAAADGLQGQLDATNAALDTAIQKALEFYAAMGGPEAENARLKLEGIRQSVNNVSTQASVSAKQINDTLVNGLTSAFDRFSQAVAEGQNVFKSLRDAFLQFAADFLRQIAQMILQAALFNALGGGAGGSGGAGGFLSGLIGGLLGGGGKAKVAHTGGLISQVSSSRNVSPAWFTNAMRYHEGGIAGLKPGEVPAILERGEEVLTANDPRHAMNGGGQSPVNVKVVNTIDPGSFVSEGLNTPHGEQSVLNFMRANQQSVRSALGV